LSSAQRVPLLDKSASPPIYPTRPVAQPGIGRFRAPAQDDAIRRSLSDPASFAEKWLQTILWPGQIAIINALVKERKVAVKACHSSGKTFLAATATLWWLARYPESLVITTAPTDRQVRGILWGEIHGLLSKSLYPFPKANQQDLFITTKRRAFGFTTNVSSGDEGTKFQGFHNSKVLVILDEAPGIDGALWTAVEGLLASGETSLLAIGNPTISSGPFYDAFGIARVNWDTFTISAFDTPNLKGLFYRVNRLIDGRMKELVYGDPDGRDILSLSEDELDENPIPYLISRRWVKERYVEWGPDHPHFVSRVLGEFPNQSPDSLLSIAWLEAAGSKTKKGNGKLTAGVDVAGPGESETVLVIRDGPQIIHLQGWEQPDPRGEVVSALLPYKDRVEINVDNVGIGYYLARHLEDLGFQVYDVNVGLPSRDSEKYSNLKAEFYWGLRMRLSAGDLCGLDDEMTIAQLAGIRFKSNARGQTVIESKEDAAKRGVKSPDRAEAVMLAFAPSLQHGLFGYWEELAKEQPPEKESTLLSERIKLASGDDLHKVEEVRVLGKVALSNQQTDVCPTCGNAFLAKYNEGAWRCNACGDTSQAHLNT